jgi:hypothetical protein
MKVFFTVVGLAISLAGSTQSNLTLYFDFNKHELTPASRTSLDSLLQTPLPAKKIFVSNFTGIATRSGRMVIIIYFPIKEFPR